MSAGIVLLVVAAFDAGMITAAVVYRAMLRNVGEPSRDLRPVRP